MNDIRKLFKKVLINYTDECIEELYSEFCDKNLVVTNLKNSIIPFLKNKYNIIGSPNKAQRNYWIIRGFSEEFANIEIKKYSKIYDTNSIEAIIKRHNVSLEYAVNIQKKRSEKSINTLNKRTDIDEINKSKAITIYNLIKKYGEEEGTKRYKKYNEGQSKNCSLSGYIERYGEEEGTKRYKNFCKKVKKQNTLSGYIERYGEEKGYQEYYKTQKKKSKSHTLSGYIERYGEEKGTKKFHERQIIWQKSLYEGKTELEIEQFNKNKGFNIQKYIDRHGEEKAFEYIQKKKSCVSRESILFFLPLYKFCRKNNIQKNDIYFGAGTSKEFFLKHKNGFFCYDFTIRSLKIIIEYNGIVFHGKDENDLRMNPYGIPLCEVYKKDVIKRNVANENGFEVYYVWSNSNLVDEMQKIKEIIYEKNQNDLSRIT